MIVANIIPTKQDTDRADSLEFNGSTFHGSGAPWSCSASRMAKLIKDKEKMVRRAKAVAARWGTRDYTGYSTGGSTKHTENVWLPFEKALLAMGFTHLEVRQCAEYRA